MLHEADPTRTALDTENDSLRHAVTESVVATGQKTEDVEHERVSQSMNSSLDVQATFFFMRYPGGFGFGSQGAAEKMEHEQGISPTVYSGHYDTVSLRNLIFIFPLYSVNLLRN
jgi:hypothetical protein